MLMLFVLTIASNIVNYSPALSITLFLLFCGHGAYVVTYWQEHPKPNNNELYTSDRNYPTAVH